MQTKITKNSVAEVFAKLLEEERMHLGLNQEQMATRMEMSVSGYKKIISGETRKVDLYHALKLSEISGRYLFELFELDTPATRVAQKVSLLSKPQKVFVEAVTEFEKEFAISHPDSDEYITVMEPCGDICDGMIWDSVNLSKVEIGAYRRRLSESIHCGIRLNNNHLHPAYVKGDILLISKEPPRDGDVGIFVNRENGRAYIRKYRQTNPCRLEPINGYGEVFYVNSDDSQDMAKWIKFGKVVTKMRN